MPYPGLTQPVYYPTVNTIAAITNAFPAVITTQLPHGYKDGLIVRLRIPVGFGMQQANYLFAPITVTNYTATTFAMEIDTTTYGVFALPPNITLPTGQQVQAQYAQVTPVGELTSLLTNAWTNVLTANS